MEEKKKNKFLGILLIISPMLAAFAIQLVIAAIGGVAFSAFMVAYDAAHGIEWSFDQETMTYVNLYTEGQYNTFMGIVTILSEVGMLICGAVWYANIKKTEVGLKALLKPYVIIGALILGLGMQGVTSFLLNLIYFIFPESWTSSYDSLMESMLDTGSPLMVISVAILAPIAEELFFRGLCLNFGRRYFPVWVALIIQAVCFGILHMNPVQFTYATLMGLVLGLVALEYESVWPGIIVHIGVNASAEVLTLLNVEISVLLMTIVGAILCALVICGYILQKKRKKI